MVIPSDLNSIHDNSVPDQPDVKVFYSLNDAQNTHACFHTSGIIANFCWQSKYTKYLQESINFSIYAHNKTFPLNPDLPSRNGTKVLYGIIWETFPFT